MKTAVIIAEYNPLHNGHIYHIEETRRLSCADNIAVIMSGNFVQRGEAAVLDKYERAKHAIMCGADIVIELPCLYALSSAAYFADGAVRTAALIKNITHLSFGSESGNVNVLRTATALTESTNYSQVLLAELDKGLSYPAAAQIARQQTSGEQVLLPNDTLAVEYIKCLDKYLPGVMPIAVKRLGNYNDNSLTDLNAGTDVQAISFASATAIRAALNSGIDLTPHLPVCLLQSLKNAPKIDTDRLYTLIAAQILNGFTDVYEDNEGLVNRVKHALLSAQSYEELIELSHTKRYTKSRIRRFLLHIALMHSPELLGAPIDYTRVLAVNVKKRKLLSDVINIKSDSALYANDIYADHIYSLITSSLGARRKCVFTDVIK